ncbi:hypothetical protein N7509_000470 [Penicillium cosmopolitanum]|uniref:Uncharacterized protein n=1 Tax=Penicillium cosmopolitanum TaxID=1131564 RepID=A0A9W9WAN2_9EURO|nr:uncharacterized protein N7509_000470 [Penicillium cosmopolitanum]KAJ5413843.1 hypothetical protein N7509_000470 [Penicillium cosmopolitanum]
MPPARPHLPPANWRASPPGTLAGRPPVPPPARAARGGPAGRRRARVRLGSPHALAEAARGGAPGTGGGTRVTAGTGPWPDPYRHALRVTPAAHYPPARPLPRRRTSQPDPAGPVRDPGANWPAGPRIYCLALLSTSASPRGGLGRGSAPPPPPTGAPPWPTNWRIPAPPRAPPANWRISRRPVLAAWPPDPEASNAEDSGAPPRRFERALTHRPAGNFRFRPQQGASWLPIPSTGPRALRAPPLRGSPTNWQPPASQPWAASRHGRPCQLATVPPQRAAATNRRIPMSRPPTGESAPAEHNGLAPAGSPLPSRHPALPDP